jgi:hypothetical protein
MTLYFYIWEHEAPQKKHILEAFQISFFLLLYEYSQQVSVIGMWTVSQIAALYALVITCALHSDQATEIN